MRFMRYIVLGLLALGVAIQATPAAAHTKQPAAVSVAQQTPTTAELGPGTMQLAFVFANSGPGDARNIKLAAELDPSAGQVIDVIFSRSGAWVTSISADRLTAAVESLPAGDSLTMTVRYTAKSDAPLVPRRAVFTWEDKLSGGRGVTNPPEAPPAGPIAPAAAPGQLTVVQTSDSTRVLFMSNAFAAGEQVACWYNTPSGAVPLLVIDNRELVADASAAANRGRASITPTATAGTIGTVALTFDTAGLPPGNYTMVMQGLVSNVTAVGTFQR